jgi:nitrogen regulatory protein P-II 1
MKLVKAILKPERFEFVRKALEENGFTGMTVTTVDGQGEQKHFPPDNCDSLNSFDLQPRIQIDIVVDYAKVDTLIGTIVETCRTEYVGDCRICVIPVEKGIRVVKGEVLEEIQTGGTFGIVVPRYAEISATDE